MKTVIDFILKHWDLIAPAIYEIIVRVIPTKKNLSLIDNGWKILNLIIKNKRKPDVNDVMESYSGNEFKNKISVPQSKHILFSLLILISFSSFAQNPNNQFNGVYITDPGSVDTTLIKNTRATLATFNGPTGGIMFDKTNNKWRVWNPALSIWVDWKLFNASSIPTGNFWKLAGQSDATDDMQILPTLSNVWSLSLGNNTGLFNNILMRANAGIFAESNGSVNLSSDAGNTNIILASNLSMASTSNIGINSGGSIDLISTAGEITLGATSDIEFTSSAGSIDITSAGTFISTSAAATTIGGTVTTINANSGDLILHANSNAVLDAGAGDVVLQTGGLERLEIDADGSFTVSGTDGTAGQALVSNGAGSSPTWQTVATPTLTATQIAYGSAGNAITSEAALNYDAATNTLHAENINVTSLSAARGVVYQDGTTNNLSTESNFQYDATLNSAIVINGTGTSNRMIGNSVQGGYEIVNGTSNTTIRLGGIDITSTSPGSGLSVNMNNGAASVAAPSFRNNASGNANITFTLFPAGTGQSILVINNIPTASAGLPSGAVWSNAGVLTIVP